MPFRMVYTGGEFAGIPLEDVPMPSVPRKDKGIYFEIPLDLIDAFKELSVRARRTLKEEVVHAMQRHLESPPLVIYKMETPELKPAKVEIEKPRPRRGPGRPRTRPLPNVDESIPIEEVD